MKEGETVYIGDGAYLHFTGWAFEFRANHHERPTDTVSIDVGDVDSVLLAMSQTMERLKLEEFQRHQERLAEEKEVSDAD